jgi:transposase
MGRRASIKPNKSINSLEELTKLYKKEKDTRVQKRVLAMKMILEDQNIFSYDVGRRLSCSPTSIREWVKRYNQGGYEALKQKSPRGNNTKITEEEFLKIIEEIPLGDPRWTLQRIALLTQQKHKDGIKKFAVWYRLKKVGIHGRVADHITPGQTNRSKRHLKNRG